MNFLNGKANKGILQDLTPPLHDQTRVGEISEIKRWEFLWKSLLKMLMAHHWIENHYHVSQWL